MILDQIVADKRKELEILKSKRPLRVLEKEARNVIDTRRSLSQAIDNRDKLHLICELKKASPSEGLLRNNFDPASIVEEFQTAGASAISILTERKYFQGNPDIPRQIRSKTTLPLLRKDFIFEPYQVFETSLLGADVFLLIVAILEDKVLTELIQLGQELGLETLVEVHSEDELHRALNAGARIIGINSRNLKTLTIDPSVPEKLIAKVPRDKKVVVESGISSYEDIKRYQKSGARCFLIGTILMKSQNITDTILELLGQK